MVVQSLKTREDEMAAAQLADAKAQAASRKELFDYEKLKAMCATVYEHAMHMSGAERERYFEELYYVGYPDVMSLAEFSETVTELSRWM